jgi:membrane-associated phospholipid phosphatase
VKSKFKLFFLFAFLLWCITPVKGQYIHKNCIGTYVKSYFTDTKKYVTAPLHWHKKEVFIFSGVAATTGLLFWQDEWIQNQISLPNSNQQAVLDYGINNFGNGLYSLPLLGGLFVYGTLAKKEVPFNAAITGVKAFVLSTFVTRVLKYSFNRYRPSENRGADFFGGPFTPLSLSFPSGHSTIAFALATVLAKNYQHHKWIPVASFTLASGVAIARVWSKEHWASDVFIGALVGWSVGTIVTNIDCSNNKTGFKIEGNGIRYVF